MVRSTDSVTESLDIVAGVLLGGTSAQYIVIICQDYVLWTSVDLIKNVSHKRADDIP